MKLFSEWSRGQEIQIENSRLAIFEHRILEEESKINLIKAKNEGRESKGAVTFGQFLR